MKPKLEKTSSGKKGEKVRSDCYFELEYKETGGIEIQSVSKVESLYGETNELFIKELCDFFEIKNLNIYFEDSGALPFTIAARFEAAIKLMFPEIKKEFLVPQITKTTTSKERLRRSRLYLPGNEPKFFINAGLHKPDGIILDLEDSVAPSEKYSARFLVRNALRSVDFYGAEKMVRINQLPKGLEDLDYVIPHNVNLILIPKCETEEEVIAVEDKITEIKKEYDISDNIFLMPIIESAKGIMNAYQIAQASDLSVALTIGLEDYTADIGAQRTLEGRESFYARSVIVNAAKVCGLQAIDSVFSDVSDMEGLEKSVLEAKSLGFEGKGCIHPRQIEVIHKAFAPTQSEIEKAQKIIDAFNDAKSKGLGVVALGSKMIDPPVVKRAERVIHLAKIMNLI